MRNVTICNCSNIIKNCVEVNVAEYQQFKNKIKGIDIDPIDYYYCFGCDQFYIFKKVNIEQKVKESKLTHFGLEDPLEGVSKNELIQKDKGEDKREKRRTRYES